MSSIVTYKREFDKEDSLNIENFDDLISSSVAGSSLGKEKKIAKGKISNIDTKTGIIRIDTGLKSEGFLSISEFFKTGESENLKTGDEVDIYIESLDTKEGKINVSHAKAIREQSWLELVNANKNDEAVKGIAFSRVKGGVSVDYNGVMAFLPGSQIDVRPVRDISNIIGQKIDYKVLSIESKARSVIFSRKVILESERSEDRDKFLSGVSEGDALTGIVKNITNYGAFVDLGIVDGLLHITDIAWERVNHPSEVLTIGQEINVKVIKFDPENRRLSLGMKQLSDNPWLLIKDKYKKGTVINGKIINITTYGVFVQLEPGIEGLLHVSEMGWTKDVHKKHKELQLDQEIKVSILEVDINKHRIALSIKNMLDNPWVDFANKHKPNDVLTGTIRNVTDFGLFIGIEGVEVDGLAHISDLVWGGDGALELGKYSKGDEIKVVYLESNLENQRIRFGVKQLTEDPMKEHSEKIKKGDIIPCTVINIKEDGVEVEILGSVRSFIKKSHLSKDRKEQKEMEVGDTFDAKIIQYTPGTSKVVLSIKDYEEEENNKALEKYNTTETGSTIGSIIGDAIEFAKKSDK